MKRLLSILLSLLLILTAVPASLAEEAAPSDILELAHAIQDAYASSISTTSAEYENAQALMTVNSMEEAEVPMYFIYSSAKENQKVFFFNGNNSVAYMEIEELFDSLKTFMSGDEGFALNSVYADKMYLAVRENGEYALIDFENGAVIFSDYDMFGHGASSVSGGDILATETYQKNEDGSIKTDENGVQLVNLFQRVDNAYNFTRSGYSLAAPLALGNIPIYWVEDKGYMPVTTFADLFLSMANVSWIYNGNSLFVTTKQGFDKTMPDENGKTLNDILLETSTDRTKELAEYTYNEMVLMLEGNYGLRDEHRVGDDFDKYFEAIGLKDRLMSQDGAEFSDALAELLLGYFGDLHSGLVNGSPFAGADYQFDFAQNGNLSISYGSMVASMTRYHQARAKSTSIGIDGNAIPYMESGNTAYITFDHFTMDPTQQYYNPDMRSQLASAVASDNVALIHYANERITRENSPIENVVIDLSLNGGGMADAAFYVISWVLGTCDFSTVNPLSEAQYTVGYKADVNLDGYITDEDHLDLSKYKVFCLTSECSFSCGNLVPAAFKESGRVTLMGRKSGGGACAVEPTIAADGTVYQYSSRYRLSTVRNGSYYSIDQGIEPDFVISDLSHLYDRAWLTEYINQLP